MALLRGYDAERAGWSDTAAERLLPPILRQHLRATKIEWLHRPGGDLRRLDTEYGVDALVHTPRRRVALAVRIRGSDARPYRQVTLRDESLQTPGCTLETDKSVARFMFYGYADTVRPAPPSSMADWYIVWLQRLMDGYQTGRVRPDARRSNHDGSSTFVCFGVDALALQGLVLHSSDPALPPF